MCERWRYEWGRCACGGVNGRVRNVGGVKGGGVNVGGVNGGCANGGGVHGGGFNGGGVNCGCANCGRSEGHMADMRAWVYQRARAIEV